MTRPPAPLVLASASPRRQEILRRAGIDFITAVSDAEDGLQTAGRPQTVALAGARAKALDVAPRFPGSLVVGADTVVALGRHVLGKPADADDARRMLGHLSGRRHEVHTAIVVARGGSGELLAEACETSAVAFHRLSAAMMEQYVATGDPLDKAGAYGLQSSGGALVSEVMGSYLNVVGLPLARLLALLEEIGETYDPN
jgi:septum formation protein